MHFANMRIMGHRNLLSGLISEMNRSYKAAIGRSVNSPLMMKRYNEFSCNTHKKKGDDTLANSARSMPNWYTSGVSELGGCDARGIIASEVRRDAGHTLYI